MNHAANSSSVSVLVVEDEPLQRMMAIDLVEEAGLDPVEALDAGDALRILELRRDIRIVFTDVDMPGGIDGIALALKVRGRWPLIEVIIVSGKRMPEVEDLPELGVFFSKPYKRSEVVETLQRFAG